MDGKDNGRLIKEMKEIDLSDISALANFKIDTTSEEGATTEDIKATQRKTDVLRERVLPPVVNALQKLGIQLSRGQFVTANLYNAVDNMIYGDPEEGKENLRLAWKSIASKEPPKEAQKSFGDIFRKQGARWTKQFGTRPIEDWKYSLMGLMADIAFDPTTWVTFGASKGVALAGRELSASYEKAFLKFQDRLFELKRTTKDTTRCRSRVKINLWLVFREVRSFSRL